MQQSSELLKPFALRLFEQGFSVRRLYVIFEGYANRKTIDRWSKEFNERQSKLEQQEAA